MYKYMYMYNIHVLGYIISPASRAYPLPCWCHLRPLFHCKLSFLICSYYELPTAQFMYVAVAVGMHCIVSGPPKQTDCLHPVGALLCRSSLRTQAWHVNSF